MFPQNQNRTRDGERQPHPFRTSRSPLLPSSSLDPSTSLGYTSAIRNDSASFQYDHTTHRFFDPTTSHISPPTAPLLDSPSTAVEPHPSSAPPSTSLELTETQVPPSPWECAWCVGQQPRVRYESWDKFYVHYYTAHPDAESWIPRKCLWWGCDNGITYTTRNSWLQHVPRKHQKTVYCDYDDCEFGRGRKALGTQQDKKRHYQDIHEPAVHCQLEYCTHTKRRLNRSEHKKRHMTKYHGSNCCKFPGCERGHIDTDNYGFSTPAELSLHMQKRRHPPAKSQWSARA